MICKTFAEDMYNRWYMYKKIIDTVKYNHANQKCRWKM